jgi:hypothetical protein
MADPTRRTLLAAAAMGAAAAPANAWGFTVPAIDGGALAPIPLVDCPAGISPARASARAEPERLALLIRQAGRLYTRPGLRLADARTRAWASGIASPYAAEIRDLAADLGRPGAFLLNYSYEWGCTAGAAPGPHGGAMLLRTLDWPFDGLGHALIVVRRQSEVGPYLSATWPGVAGVLTGLAPGRFAAAINQPPLPLPGWGRPFGWLAARWLADRSRAMPPDHLLRLAFETAADFASAVALIRRTPLCMPAIFTLAGPNPGEAMVIERDRDAAHVAPTPFAANHWAAAGSPPGRPRNHSSHARRQAMAALAGQLPSWSLAWVRAPILQPDTRLAMMADPASGRLLLQGWERSGPATAVFDLR